MAENECRGTRLQSGPFLNLLTLQQKRERWKLWATSNDLRWCFTTGEPEERVTLRRLWHYHIIKTSASFDEKGMGEKFKCVLLQQRHVALTVELTNKEKAAAAAAVLSGYTWKHHCDLQELCIDANVVTLIILSLCSSLVFLYLRWQRCSYKC